MRCWIALGGNVGDVRSAFAAAAVGLRRLGDVRAVSSLYETPPWGPVAQGRFLNAVAELETDLGAHELLHALNGLEAAASRERVVRWGPRTLDLDIVAIDGRTVSTDRLDVPHPRAAERAFVTVPLAEIAPDATLGGASAQDLAANADRGGMIVVEGPGWAD